MKSRNLKISLVLLVVFALCLMFVVEAINSPMDRVRNLPLQKIDVKKGDTLWAIAKRNTEDVSLRAVVFYIKKVNKLDTVVLNPGDKIKVPVQREVK